MELPLRNEEDAVTAAIEDHVRAYGIGDARTMARVVLDRLELHRARKAAEATMMTKPTQGEPDWPEDLARAAPNGG